MGLWEDFARAVGCGIIGLCPKQPEVETVDFCAELFKAYGGYPTTSQMLTLLAGTTCKDTFDYDGKVQVFCNNLGNFESQIGDGRTCKSIDHTRNQAVAWCQIDDRINPSKGSRSPCSESWLGDKYDEAAGNYCDNHTSENWCSCYNQVNGICDIYPNAAGCIAAKRSLEQIKKYIPVEAYDILSQKKHCRPNVCSRSGKYVPSNASDGCEPTYNICEKDLDIRLLSDSDIVLECNPPGFKIPDWWDDDHTPTTLDEYYKMRFPPFDKSPWNMLPITQWPDRFDWGNPNVRYLTFGSVSSVSSSCICIFFLMSMLSLKSR